MPAAKPTLCVLNYNGAAVLPVALQAACVIRDRFASIVVIDNGSQDGSLELVGRDFPGVEVLDTGQNLGAAGGRNVGLQRIPADLLLFIDNDVALTANCVDRLVDSLAARPDAALAVPAVLYADQPDVVQYGGAECHFLGQQILVNENIPADRVDPTTRDMGSLVSCCFLVERSRLPPGELFDDSFFIYVEDHEFGVRLRALGSTLIAVPAAQCLHGKGTEGLSMRQLGGYSSRRVFYSIRNRWLFLLKIYTFRTLLVLAPMLVFYEAAQFAVVLKKGWLREWWNSFTWVIRHLPAVVRERRRIQRQRVCPDRDLLTGGALPFRPELTTGAAERLARVVLDRIAVVYWRVARRLV
ncbi:MAG: glycosyltransferase family 2 protein [Gammaproteobacteria bacterium]|nr:MAG: glycosyltransferase family 2 protein [Gammaproteobacteria bacterium]